MLKMIFSFAVVTAISFFCLMMWPDLSDMIYYRAAPRDICEIVDSGKGLFKIYGCQCDCKINLKYVLFMLSTLIGISALFSLAVYLVILLLIFFTKKIILPPSADRQLPPQ
jgi:hypothetical protein